MTEDYRSLQPIMVSLLCEVTDGPLRKSLAQVYEIAFVNKKRPSMDKLAGLKRELNKLPPVVQRLYALTRMGDILREMSKIPHIGPPGRRLSRRERRLIKTRLAGSAAALDKLDVMFTDTDVARALDYLDADVRWISDGDTEPLADWLHYLSVPTEDRSQRELSRTSKTTRRLVREYKSLYRNFIGALPGHDRQPASKAAAWDFGDFHGVPETRGDETTPRQIIRQQRHRLGKVGLTSKARRVIWGA